MYQQLWGYKVEEKLYLGVREQKMLNTTGLNDSVRGQHIRVAAPTRAKCKRQLHGHTKVKLSRYIHEGGKGKRKYISYSFLTSTLDWVSGQRHSRPRFTAGERTCGTLSTGGWVGLTAGLDIQARETSFASPGIEPLSPGLQTDTILNELPCKTGNNVVPIPSRYLCKEVYERAGAVEIVTIKCYI
jgi:hypothetical protein